MRYKIAVSDYVFPDLSKVKNELEKIDAKIFISEGVDEESIIKVAKDADALLVCYAEISSRIIKELENCQIISRTGIGLDNIDIKAATNAGIIVTNVPNYCIEEVSDHALSLILNCVRKICQLNKTVKNEKIWDFEKYKPIYRLNGQTLGLLGFGKIPRRLVEKVSSYDFDILSFDPYIKEEIADRYGVRLVKFEELISNSDILSLHAPLTNETEGIINNRTLEKMKDTSFLINTSRGGLIKENDLYYALKNQEIAGAGIDLLASEEPSSENPLFGLDNIAITPHVAFYSEESISTLQAKAVEEIARVLKGKNPFSCVNPEVL